MRTLEFSVNGQRLKKAPDFSFNHIIMGSKNYLKAHFNFSSDWASLRKVAVFAVEGKAPEYIALKGDGCEIPNGITASQSFTVQIIGVKGNQRVPTNEITVRQEES